MRMILTLGPRVWKTIKSDSEEDDLSVQSESDDELEAEEGEDENELGSDDSNM